MPSAAITSLHLPLDNIEDRTFWDEWTSGWQFGTPLYYGPHIARFPERSAASQITGPSSRSS
jgi:protein-tyrosine phosphatase